MVRCHVTADEFIRRLAPSPKIDPFRRISPWLQQQETVPSRPAETGSPTEQAGTRGNR
jgi:hypothetical protein